MVSGWDFFNGGFIEDVDERIEELLTGTVLTVKDVFEEVVENFLVNVPLDSFDTFAVVIWVG